MFSIWIGFDAQFQKNISPLINSIKKYSNDDVSINLLELSKLKDKLWRNRDNRQSTDSAFTRWLVPYLNNYQGWHLYMDSDMLVNNNLSTLWDLRDESKAVMVVKHQVVHKQTSKFNNKIQTTYERKNWSSLILFNSNKCKNLSLDYVNTASGLDLHQFSWLQDDDIGELPKEWNHLVGVNEPNATPSIIHWTLGGPWFDEYSDVEHSALWHQLNV